jgi:virginiamycin B lyase
MNIFTDKRRLLLTAAMLALAGLARPAVAQTITEIPLSNTGSQPGDIATGPDGNLWFTEFKYDAAIGRISTDGVISEFPIPNPYVNPTGIAAGADGNLWYTAADFDTGSASLIGRITPAGVIKEFPLSPLSAPCHIIAGPDG